MKYLRLLFVTLFTSCLLSCQPGRDAGVPGPIIDWRPDPLASRTPLPELAEEMPQQEEVQYDAPAEPGHEAFTVLQHPHAVPTPGPIPTLAPTPLPAGVFLRESDSFEVVYPASWQLVESGTFGVTLFDPEFGLSVSLHSNVLAEDASYEGLVSYFQNEADFLTDVTLLSEEEIPFADAGAIKVATLTFIDEEDEEQAVRLHVMEDGNRVKDMVVYGLLEDIEARKATLIAMIGQAKPGGTQMFGFDREQMIVLLGNDPLPWQLDPARTTMGANSYTGLIYRGLVHLTPELQIVPDLAESWAVNEDGTVYTFTLREGVKFASGRPITASDIKNSWERALDPDTGSTTARTYLGDIVGAEEKFSGQAEDIAGVIVIDENTLEVTLVDPKPYFLAKLTYPTSFVVDLQSVDEEDETWVYKPNSSGPYTLRDFREEEALIFDRNDTYHEPGSIAHVVYLLYRIGSGISLFESDEIDVVFLNPIEVQEVRKPSNPLNEHWQTTTALCTSFVHMNNTLPPLDDANVRRALALAVDRQGLNDLFAEGMPVIGHTILPPAMPGYSLSLAEARQEYDHNLEAARVALSESAYADGLPEITIVASGYGDTDSDYINALVNGWQEALGADVSVEYVDPGNFSEVARESEGHLVSYGWCADYPDPQNFLEILFHSESEFNVADYKNEEIDALLQAAAIELDVARRVELYQDIEARLLADYATIPLWHNTSDVLVNPRIKGYVLSPINDSPINALSIELLEGEQ